ncbi:hypothetical protein F4818DRAFT_454617 [Hypoxylon cercidicola]|nr:hypothetical protein F4818DRAFT_454617 [Hypoxylon cercidicola]
MPAVAVSHGADPSDANQGPYIIKTVFSTTICALVVDYVIMAAMLLSLAGMGIVIASVHSGAGRHAAYLDADVDRLGRKLNFIWQLLYLWTSPLVKLSAGFFLMRIIPTVYYKRILHGVMAFLIIYTVVCQIALLLQCRNLAIIWDDRVQTTCWPVPTLQGISYTYTVMNIITDLFFALLPIPMLWNVRISTRTKASLICVLGLGVFACAAGIVKAVYLITVSNNTGDYLWDTADITIWISIETNTGIVAASLPCIKPMFKRILDSWFRCGSSHKKDTYNLHSYGRSTGPKGSKHAQSQTRPEIGGRSGIGPNSWEDDISEEIILMPHGGITKTTMITIDRGIDDQGLASGNTTGWQRDYLERVVEDRL